MTTPVFTSFFLGPISTYCEISKHGSICIESNENYQKRSFRNKAMICGSDGVRTITVPLQKGKANQMPITQVEIAYDTDWIGQILKTLKSYYGKAPYFEEIYPDLEEILKKKPTYLYDLNEEVMQWAIHFIQLDTQIGRTATYIGSYEDIDFRNTPSIKEYQTVKLRPYGQIFSDRLPFQPNLSILDLMFCKGPEAFLYLRQNQQ